ncbi:MAG TPA: decarboxylating 6-phosphogluconate dehydrogenase [Patescibacteria group bacterium]|nr:decarboxylating 6-phosphogluconate dehydrogenase [Patescibacteria group bacterium]
MEITIFGLGRMGLQIARRLHKNNFTVNAWNRSEGPRKEFEAGGGKAFETVEAAVEASRGDVRVFWVMLPNDITENFIFESLLPYLKAGDVVIDGGNSFYKDSVRRGKTLAEKGIHFFDSGTSGGVWGEENGFALMVGGPSEQWPVIEPIFKTLSSGKNYGLVGGNGAGHFVKMVHNGIEYGMMQAIAEGYGVLEESQFNLNLSQVTQIYQEGSVVRSWLIDLCKNIFDNEDIPNTSGFINATGEGEWTIKTAKELGVEVPVIEASFKVRQESKKAENQKVFSNKIVALMRKQFGGHAVEKK